ncbi:cobalamin-dependent protein [bacterium]|nr:cobalamin-dependent protein [bacterium]
MQNDLYCELKEYLDQNNYRLRLPIFKRQLELMPDLKIKYSEKQMGYCLRDIGFNLSYLAQAIKLESPNLFFSYSKWLLILMQNLRIPIASVIANFKAMKQLLHEETQAKYHHIIDFYLELGIEALNKDYDEVSGMIDPTNIYSQYAEKFINYVLNGEKAKASEMILGLVSEGVSVKNIYLDILQPVQYEIGHLWQTNKISIAQEHYATSVTQLVISQMYPFLFNGSPKDRVLLTSCVSGELHEIGLRMLSDIFELEGWSTWYLGANLPDESVIEMIKDKKPDIIALSATVMFFLEKLEKLILKIKESGIEAPIMVGGYPFIQDKMLWKKVGADGWAIDPERALKVADKLLLKKGNM